MRLLDLPYLIPLLTLLADGGSALAIDMYGPRTDKLVAIVTTVLLVTVLGAALEILRRLRVAAARTSIWGETMRLANPWLDVWITDTVMAYLRATQFDNRIVRDNLKRTMNDHREWVKGYASGRLEMAYEWPGFFNEELWRAKAEIRATSMVDPRAYWDTPKGEDYVREHQRAIIYAADKRRKLTVRRVFIQRGDDLGALRSVILLHEKLGLEVKIAVRETLDSKYLEDYMVVDTEILIRLSALENNAPNKAIVHWAADEALRNEIAAYKDRFDVLWRNAKHPGEFGLGKTGATATRSTIPSVATHTPGADATSGPTSAALPPNASPDRPS